VSLLDSFFPFSLIQAAAMMIGAVDTAEAAVAAV